MCGLLDITKRKFIETALIDALARSDKILEEEGVFAMLWEQSHPGARYPGPEEGLKIDREAHEAKVEHFKQVDELAAKRPKK